MSKSGIYRRAANCIGAEQNIDEKFFAKWQIKGIMNAVALNKKVRL